VKVGRGEVEQHLHEVMHAVVVNQVEVIEHQNDVARVFRQCADNRDGRRFRRARAISVVDERRLPREHGVHAVQRRKKAVGQPFAVLARSNGHRRKVVAIRDGLHAPLQGHGCFPAASRTLYHRAGPMPCSREARQEFFSFDRGAGLNAAVRVCGDGY